MKYELSNETGIIIDHMKYEQKTGNEDIKRFLNICFHRKKEYISTSKLCGVLVSNVEYQQSYGNLYSLFRWFQRMFSLNAL